MKGVARITNIVKASPFQDFGSGFKRDLYEKYISKSLGEKPSFMQRTRSDASKLMPKGIDIDEVRNIATGAKLDNPGYSVCVQGIEKDINLRQKRKVDHAIEVAERELQKLSPFDPNYDQKRNIIKDKYNKVARSFVKEANKNYSGKLPVRAFELSFDKPDVSVSRYNELSGNVKSLLDKNYDEFEYSFKVPKDVKTIYEMNEQIKTNPNFLKRIFATKGPRVFAIPAAAVLGTQALMSGEAEAEESNIKYNPDLGSFAEVKDIDGVVAPTKVDQSGLLNWMSENPGTTAVGTGAAALTAKPVRKGVSTAARGLLKAIGPLGTPLGLAGISTAVGGYDLEEPVDRIGLEAELAFAKPLVGQSQQIAKGFKNPMVRRGVQQVLNLGLPAKFALRAARIATPLGLASLAAEGAYYGGKAILNEYNRRKNLSDEERAAEDAENEFDLMGSA